MRDNESQHRLKTYTQLWDETLRNEVAKELSKSATEESRPLNQRVQKYHYQPHDYHNQRSDAIILEANQSFLKSIKNLRDTNQKYLHQLGFNKPGILQPPRGVIPKPALPPRNSILDPRRSHNGRDGKENLDSKETIDVDECARELKSSSLNGR
jgi:hypothetical protein